MERFDPEASPGYLVKRVQQSLRRRSDAALRGIGVSMAQYAVLRALADQPEASAAELSRRCFVTRQSLQDLLGGLRAAGLVESSGPPRGRSQALRLTPDGRDRLRGADNAVFGVEELMLDGLADGSRGRLAELLTRCAENLEAG
jgi:DNA-binding MarR family transcriptional regulator